MHVPALPGGDVPCACEYHGMGLLMVTGEVKSVAIGYTYIFDCVRRGHTEQIEQRDSCRKG
jgi:hypothetical protein